MSNDINPYESPRSSINKEARNKFRSRAVVSGIFLGGFLGALAGFFGGAICALIYSSVHRNRSHPSIFEPLGIEDLKTPPDFATEYGIIAGIILGAGGMVIGLLEGRRFSEGWRGVEGGIAFVGLGTLGGIGTGVFSTLGPGYIIPDFLEGPFAGFLSGAICSGVGWEVFRAEFKRFNARNSQKENASA